MAVGKKEISCPPSAEGTGLSDADISQKNVTYFEDHPNLAYSWTAGQAMSRFLNELKNGKLIATKCEKCRRVIFPPRIYCELCYKPIDDWVYIKDTGVVQTFSISFIDPDAKPLEKPVIVAVITIDGASPNMGIMHIIDEVEPEKVYIGMRVKAVWRPESERKGTITDIKYWKPLEG
ncbi:MAG: Zn-ribbon domain-containing OB-fold protein [Archaeoglobaceae archaeon]|nr:Zn-ribbon domain-containing OB-fold protein [Archaeoglobaceae archaeon]MDW7989864.1 Zn-ribbon domain-containing OB-fold protein [Archaeoglobaceae archaeon]